jgi:hypothetical protein
MSEILYYTDFCHKMEIIGNKKCTSKGKWIFLQELAMTGQDERQ